MATTKTAGRGQGASIPADAALADGSAPFGPAPRKAPPDLDQLFRAQGPQLLRYFARRLDAEEARDLAQETFLRFAAHQPRQALANPGAYLQRIARNLLFNRAKNVTAARERGHLPLEPGTHAANDADPYEALVARQTLERYEAALMSLKPKTRAIYLSHRLDELSYEEIARDWNMSVSGIEKQMMNAIAHIDRQLSRR